MSEFSFDHLFGTRDSITHSRAVGRGPSGILPLTENDLLEKPSGNIFGMTQNAGMGWSPDQLKRDEYLILSTQGGIRAEDGQPVALGYHTGHWELDALVKSSAQTLDSLGALPFAAFCSDPCDGRTQGTAGMMDSLPYRNDAAIVLRRLIRSLPTRKGILGIATCDKGLPAMMMALAGCSDLPALLVPGGVTLPTPNAEDTGTVQTLGARFAHGLIELEYAAEMGCRACGSPGGGCHFLGTAATSQVIAEALGLSLPFTALVPSGEPVWLEMAKRSAKALERLAKSGIRLKDVLTREAVQNAMQVHAAFGGSTNLLLHLPAIAHAAGLAVPEVEDWRKASASTPRIVDCLPNGPENFPTAFAYYAGGVPEVMLQLRRSGLLDEKVLTSSGMTLSEVLNQWEKSPQRRTSRKLLEARTGISPDSIIMSPERATEKGLSATLVFPRGNLAPQGSVVKATAISPSLIDGSGVYKHRGRARVFCSERDAIQAIKGRSREPLKAGDVLVLIGIGPLGTGMEEIYQITSALKFLPWGKQVPVLTDGRFSGVSTGACIGHVGPEALAGGPIGKLRDRDLIELEIDTRHLTGSVDLVATSSSELDPRDAIRELKRRDPHPALSQAENLPADTKLWAALQAVSGGTWRGAVYDVDSIVSRLLA